MSVNYAKILFSILAPWLPKFPYPASQASSSMKARPAHSLNSNIRLYKYTQDQRFGPHYDDAAQDTETGAKSEWTLLIYLSGLEDGVQGGEVRIIFVHSMEFHCGNVFIRPCSTKAKVPRNKR